MKKRILVLVVCLCLMVGVVASASGNVSHNNVLISKSYLEGTFWQELQNVILQRISDADDALTNAYVDGVNNLGQAQLDKLVPQDGDVKWITSGSFKTWSGEFDDTIILSVGAGVVWFHGLTQLMTGSLIDLTVGGEIGVGEALVGGHRYVAAEQSLITIISDTASWSAEGQWYTTAEEPIEADPEPSNPIDPEPTDPIDPEPTDPVDPEPTDPVDPDPTPVMQFTDVPAGIWYYDAVCYAVERGLFKGTSDTTFEPSKTMNRAMLATVIYRMSESPETAYSPVFTDVPDGMWYSSAIVWAAENKIVNGMGDGTYKPTGDLTREQIAVLLYNYANLLGLDTSARADLSTISDGNAVSSWAMDAMAWAVHVGLFQGDANGMLTPRDSATRAAVAVLLQRFEQLRG